MRCVPAFRQVLTESIALDGVFEDDLNDRLVLVFTGKQRLARWGDSPFSLLSGGSRALYFRR